jgi:hypothetical protein
MCPTRAQRNIEESLKYISGRKTKQLEDLKD